VIGSGTDADWVMKLIYVYPDDDPRFVMSGYQLMVSGDIFRGRYREDLTKAKPLAANQTLEYVITLPHETTLSCLGTASWHRSKAAGFRYIRPEPANFCTQHYVSTRKCLQETAPSGSP
jgi:hypothetical protein